MEKTKLLTIAVIALLVVNVTTLTFLWLNRHRPPQPFEGRDRNGRPPAAVFLINQLNFDEAQTTTYDRLRIAERKTKDSLQVVLREQRKTLFRGIASNDTSKIAEIGEIQKEFDRTTFHHFREVRALCNPQQQVKFDQIIGEVLQMMANKKPPPPLRQD